MTEDFENKESQIPETSVENRSPVVLTERDIAVFQFAHEQRYLCYNQISGAFWKERSEDAKACRHRVAKLLEAGYLTKKYSGKMVTDVYFASEKAVEVLKKRSLDSGLLAIKPSDDFDRNIVHDLHVTDLRIFFREMGLFQWTSERILWERDHLYHKPDAVLTIRSRKIAIEFENGITKGIKRYRELFDYYDDHEGYRLLFVIVRGDTRDWLMGMDYDARKTWFVTFKELMNKKEKSLFENKRGSFELSRLL